MTAATAALSQYYSSCLQTNLPLAIHCILGSDATPAFQKRVESRFVTQSERLRIRTVDPLVRAVVSSYRNYYRDALLRLKKKKHFESVLLESLNSLCLASGLIRRPMGFEKIEEVLIAEFRRRGFYSLFGEVSPLRSLLVWRKQHAKTYHVELSDTLERVKVVFLEDFVELSWLHYATFGRHYVGGWAGKEALYCVKQIYDLKSEKFRASYLTHEARHFSDYKKFPKLSAGELEYRAKLSEIIATTRARKLLDKFKREACNNKTLPHSYAAFRIIKNLKLDSPSVELRRQAESLLSIHTKLLQGRRT